MRWECFWPDPSIEEHEDERIADLIATPYPAGDDRCDPDAEPAGHLGCKQRRPQHDPAPEAGGLAADTIVPHCARHRIDGRQARLTAAARPGLSVRAPAVPAGACTTCPSAHRGACAPCPWP